MGAGYSNHVDVRLSRRTYGVDARRPTPAAEAVR
jgi:hypothetical protein